MNQRVIQTQSAAKADGTKANIRSHVNSYLAFCIYFSLVAFPLSSTNVLPFLQLISESVTSFYYVNNVLSSIKSVSHMFHHVIDQVTSINLSLFMSGLKRNMTTPVTQRLPITPQILISMSGFVDFSNSFHVSVWSAILVMFFLIFKKI